MSLGSAEIEESGQKPYMCKICSERFVTKHFLSFHMTKTHPNCLAFECNTCHKAFKLAVHLEIHKGICNANKPKENTTVNSEDKESSPDKINSKSERKRKDNKSKKTLPENRLQKKDEKTIVTKNKRKQNKETLNGLFKKPESQFIALRERKELQRLPPGETITYIPEVINGRTYKRCSFCNTLLSSSIKHCQIHSNRHLRIKPHICKYCGAGFTTDDAIDRHLRSHTNQKPFACKFCPEKFTCPQTLKFHLRAHAGIKLYQCEHCQEKFIRYCTMRNHIINKHIL